LFFLCLIYVKGNANLIFGVFADEMSDF